MGLKRILKNGGYLILSVPNISYIFYRIVWALGKVSHLAAKAYFTYSPSGFEGHVRDYNFK